MAGYTIGSDKGKQIANSMKVGGTYKAADGSTWKKNNKKKHIIVKSIHFFATLRN